MENQESFEKVVKKVKSIDGPEKKMQRVYEKYKDMFKLGNIMNLDVEKFLHFFSFSENEHWTGLTQNIRTLVEDPEKLKKALLLLLDESKPLRERINKVTGNGSEPGMVKGFGPARLSAFLNVATQGKYGIYNTISMKGLSKIGMSPESNRGWSTLDLGERFVEVNNKLKELSEQYDISLWALDWVWYEIVSPEKSELEEMGNKKMEGTPSSFDSEEQELSLEQESAFTLERQLEIFLEDNWDKTILNRDLGLEILTDDNTGEAIGRQYPTEIGIIDFLCKNKKTGGFTVIELKRYKASDTVVGQLQRYMGWIMEKEAKGAPVDGIIICQEVDERLKYALKATQSIKYYQYHVSFQLRSGD
jgi:hypothetical protein